MTANCSVVVVTLFTACAQLYSGPKEVLRIIHNVLLAGSD